MLAGPVLERRPQGHDCVVSMRGAHACSLTHSCLQPTRLLGPWDSPGKNTGVGCHFLLQGVFPPQGLNLPVLRLVLWQAGSLP